MADTKYAVVHTDRMTATDVRTGMWSFRFGTGTGSTFEEAAIENGTLVTLKGLIERDLWEANAAASTAQIGDIVLVTTPEVLYDDRHQKLSDFINEAGTNCTGMTLYKNDIFSVTAEAFEGTTAPAVGNKVAIGTDGKLALQTAAAGGKAEGATTTTGTVIGQVIEVWIHNREKYYRIKVG